MPSDFNTNSLIKYIIIFFIGGWVNIAWPADLQLDLAEAQARFTFEIGKHIQWPNESEIKQFHIAIYGNDPDLKRAIEKNLSAKIHNKPVIASNFEQEKFLNNEYHLVFVTYKKRTEMRELLNYSRTTLLIVEGRFNREDIMIGMLNDNNRIKLEINRENIISKGFGLSASLLDFAGTREDLSQELKSREVRLEKLLADVNVKQKELDILVTKLNDNSRKLADAEKKLVTNNKKLEQYKSQLEVLEIQIKSSQEEISNNKKFLSEQKLSFNQKEKEIAFKEIEVKKLQENIETNKNFIETQLKKIDEQQGVIENRNQTISSQRGWLKITIFIASIFVILIYSLIRLNRSRQHSNAELKVLNEKLFELATTDGLTNLYNRRHFIAESEKQLQRAKRNQFSAALLMIDIDKFKQVNDAYGHPMGDQVIRSVADILGADKRKYDIVGRLGGEEFSMLLMDCKIQQANEIATRLKEKVAKTMVSYQGAETIVTISIGISEIYDNDEKIESAMSRADKALYQAKESGRNRVVTYYTSEFADE